MLVTGVHLQKDEAAMRFRKMASMRLPRESAVGEQVGKGGTPVSPEASKAQSLQNPVSKENAGLANWEA